jgi:hypothetical protein
MEKEQRTRLQKATQDARKLLEEEFRSQLLQTYDIDVDKVRWAEEPGAHLLAEQRLIREKLVAWIEHKEAQINDRKEALLLALREMAFTALNRFVALKLMEARELVRPCVSGELESAGFLEFTAVAQGLLADQESSYRLFLETIFEDVSRELRALFDPRDPASLLWPKRAALLELLDILNRPELAELWSEDETLGWVYQYFNGDAERKKMREESAAPRNSRELAVRNQFFTPRYVVEFLTDNTLGRIWYEMRQGQTGLKDRCRYLVRRPNEIWLQPGEKAPARPGTDQALSQEEILRQPVHILHRELKDPREIRLLDPACGSMHFGLYAFDLYLEIYIEAWDITQSSDELVKQCETFASFAQCAAGFAGKEAFLREVPKLILQHNIYGIDIDPRATQIARLTLWLRAQRAWHDQQIEVASRPAVTRSNVVCAEPMPGEKELLVDFVDQQFPEVERGLVQQLLETIFDRMQFAGEAGSLLKIEEEIRDAINRMRGEWQKLAVQQRDLFSPAEMTALGQAGSLLSADLQNLTQDFWPEIETRIYAALHKYSEIAEDRGGFQRRLFTEDAAQGIAFIDLCRQRFDAVVMNPPFGEVPKGCSEILAADYHFLCDNLYCGFIQRASQLASPSGYSASITDRSYLIKQSFEKIRGWIIDEKSFEIVVDLGWGVLDANVETCATVFRRHSSKALFADIGVEGDNRSMRLAELCGGLCDWNILDIGLFEALPFKAISYAMPRWMSEGYADSNNQLSASLCLACRGMAGGNAEQLYRVLHEVDPSDRGIDKRWITLQKGSPYSPFYYSPEYLLLHDSGTFKTVLSYDAGRVTGIQHYGRSGLSFGKRTDLMYAYPMSREQVFSLEGQAVMPLDGVNIWQCLAVLNSSVFQRAVNAICGQHKMHGYVNAVHLPFSSFPDCSALAQEISISLSGLDTGNELSQLFVCPLFAKTCKSSSLKNSLSSLIADRRRKVDICKQKHFDINKAIASSAGAPEAIASEGLNYSTIRSIFGQEGSVADEVFNGLSWTFGVVQGRWDIRYATGEKVAPESVDLFAPLPVCSPGQLQNAQGLPADQVDLPASYPVRIAWDGIIVNDSNHPQDLVHCIREVIGIIWSGQEGILSDQDGKPTAHSIEHEACDILGVSSLRDYFRKPAGFFAEHLKRYSKSRRQAPIYWQLSAGSGGYSAWLYYHRFTQDTLYRVLRDFVEPRIQQTEREQFELESQGALSGDAAARLQEAQTLLQDLRILKGELDLVAPMWNPNINDGVIINHAILWRITPYTPWQKKCKECWDKLVKGDYDWAHVAFHLWPERVIPKCTTDRSLAIAHGLEERLWQATNNGNWLPRQLSDTDLQALIAEHSNPAVKSALERLLAAPPPVAPTRPRVSRSTRASGSSAPRRTRGTAAVVDAEASRQVLLALTAAPIDGLAKAAIADLIGVEASALTAVIKQLKESGQIDQLGERRGARYVLSEQGRARLDQEEAG